MSNQAMFRVVLAAALIVATFFPDSRVYAQWSTDPNINNAICTVPVSERGIPVMVADGAGGAILAWHSMFSPEALQFDVYAQRIDSSALFPWGEAETAVANSRLDQHGPFIVSDGAGGANITWGMEPRNGSWYEAFAQRLSANGAQRWARGGQFVDNTQTYAMFDPLVTTTDGTGGSIIAYADASQLPRVTRIRASGDIPEQFDGVPIGNELNQSRRAIVDDGVGGALVAFAANTSGIRINRVDSSGVVQWGANGVGVSSAGSGNAVIVGDGSGGAILAWNRNQFIYAQRVDHTGSVQWTTDGVAISAASSLPVPAIVSDGNDGAIIAWRENTALKAQRINGAGVVQWASGGVAISPTVSLVVSNHAAMVSDNSGGAIITWSDPRSGLSNLNIYAQRINGSGVVQWAANGVAISTAPGNQTNPVIVTNGAGGAIIAWVDARNPPPLPDYGGHIYAQRVNANGQLGGTTDVPENDPGTPDAFKLNQGYPNPFNPVTTFTFTIPHAAHVMLSIFNALGQEVATVVDEPLTAGSYSRTFNAAGLASGAYFYRLTADGYSETRRMLLLK